MRNLIAIVALTVLFLSGCLSVRLPVARFIAPIQVSELEPAAQKMLAVKDRGIAEVKADALKVQAVLQTEIAKLKTTTPPKTPIVLYLVAVGIMLAGVAVGYFLKQWGLCGLSVALGIVLIGTLRFLDIYPWAGWIAFGLGVAAAGLFAYRYWQGADAKTTVATLVPAVEALGKTGDEVKAQIETTAAALGTSAVVKRTVTAVKAAIANGK